MNALFRSVDDFPFIAFFSMFSVALSIICLVLGQLIVVRSICLWVLIFVLCHALMFMALAAFIWLAWSLAILELVVVPQSGAAYRMVEFTMFAPTWLRALFVRKGFTVLIIAILAFIAFIMLFLHFQMWLSKLMYNNNFKPEGQEQI